MNKEKILQMMCLKLEKDLQSIKAAALATLDAATNEESKAENKYDTRGLEASYLAGAQAKRVREMEEQLSIFKSTKLRHFAPSDPISTTALVEVQLNEKVSFVFIIEKGGGLVLLFDGNPVQAIAPNSPLGKALLGRRKDDEVLVESNDSTRTYNILNIT